MAIGYFVEYPFARRDCSKNDPRARISHRIDSVRADLWLIFGIAGFFCCPFLKQGDRITIRLLQTFGIDSAGVWQRDHVTLDITSWLLGPHSP